MDQILDELQNAVNHLNNALNLIADKIQEENS